MTKQPDNPSPREVKKPVTSALPGLGATGRPPIIPPRRGEKPAGTSDSEAQKPDGAVKDGGSTEGTPAQDDGGATPSEGKTETETAQTAHAEDTQSVEGSESSDEDTPADPTNTSESEKPAESEPESDSEDIEKSLAEFFDVDEDEEDSGNHNDSPKPSRWKRSHKAVPIDWVVATGEILFIVGLTIILFCFHVTIATPAEANRAHEQELELTVSEWKNAKPAPENEPAPFPDPTRKLILTLPTLDNRPWVVQPGVEPDNLAVGPGFFPESTPANIGVAGHRDGWTAPFENVDQLKSCDPIVIQSPDWKYTYRVLPYGDSDPACFTDNDIPIPPGIPGQRIVEPTDVWVVDENPREPTDPTEMVGDSFLLTLTTCHPHWSNSQRLIIHAALTDVERISHDQIPDK